MPSQKTDAVGGRSASAEPVLICWPVQAHVIDDGVNDAYAAVMRGGARVVFLFSGEDVPVFLLTVFAKNEKTGLSAGERTALVAVAKQMVEDYRRHQ